MKLKNKEIIVGVTGGVACYKTLELVRSIKKEGGNVTVIMTASAMEFIKPMAFQAVSGREVLTDLFSLEEEKNIGHITVAENADAMIVAPATANYLGKAANGIADDYLTTVTLALKAPLFVAPAMNHNMWEHPATQQNRKTLLSRNVIEIPPEYGEMACGTVGVGRLAQVETIMGYLTSHFEREKEKEELKQEKPLQGISVLITAGPTQEKIDAVRYISNYSTGKMGYAIAACCRDLGADVTLVSGPTSIKKPEGVNFVPVLSAMDMYDAVMARAENCNLIIKSAAVADYRIEDPNPHKTKKKDTIALNLVQNPDILKKLGSIKKEDQFLVGFAAESQRLEEYARKKLVEKNLDLIVANNILQEDAGFNADTNRVLLIEDDSIEEVPLLHKDEVAEKIIAHVLNSKRWKERVGTKK